MIKNRNVVTQLVRRAEKAGFKAIALTVDTPLLGRREADIKNRLAIIWKYKWEESLTLHGSPITMVELINYLLLVLTL